MSNASDFIIENGVLTKYVGPGGNVVIPDSVTSIGSRSFEFCSELSGVSIPDSVTSIGESAFHRCRGLSKVEIPSGVKIIGDLAFNDTSLRKIEIPGTVERIGEGAFISCQFLESIVIHDGVVSIGRRCFPSAQVTAIHLPQSVTMIEQGAFPKGLREFSAPGAKISALADVELKTLAVLDFMKNPERYQKAEVIESYHKQLFTQKKKWLPIIFKEDNVALLRLFGDSKKIAADNFEEEFLSLAVGSDAKECIAYLLDWKGRSCDDKVVKKSTKTALDGDPYSVGEMKKQWLYQIVEDGTVEILGYKGTETEVRVPPRIGANAVSRLGERVFSPTRKRITKEQAPQMHNIVSIFIPNSITGIHSTIAMGCRALEKLVVEDGNPIYHTSGNCLIETQTKTLIAGCKASVIPNDGSVTTIGGFAFGECDQLPEITIPEAVACLDSAAFAYCTGLEKIVIPASISVIPNYCFAQCKELKQVDFPDTITEIGHFAMYACLKLKSVYVPASVKTIGEEVFCKATISGVAGSYAETYAKEHNKKFVAK